MASESNSTPVQPLLASLAVSRHGEPSIPGYFDPALDVWVVESSGGLRPIVQMREGLGDTSTVTRVRAEQDDTDIDPASLANTTTFTKVLAEGDDTDVSCAGLLEMTTKTQAQIESDDHVFTIDAFSPSDEDRPTAVFRIQ